MDNISEQDQWPINQRMIFELTSTGEGGEVAISTKDGFLSLEKFADSLRSYEGFKLAIEIIDETAK
jgi:hypothetical protein